MKAISRATHSVIICTLNRVDSLNVLLDSILATGSGKNIQIIVVDSSNDLEYRKSLKAFILNCFNETSNVIFEKGGLPSSRNRAIEFLNKDMGEFVHFFDDDITIEPTYFKNVEDFFAANRHVDGGGPRIKGLYADSLSYLTKWQSRFEKILETDHNSNFGRLTASGRNFWIPDKMHLEPQFVDWIPGCCMIFRRKIFDNLRFNVSLENGPGKNYALGEDVDFTWRVSLNHTLSSIPTVSIEHHLRPSKRDNKKIMMRAQALWLGYLVKLAPSRVKTSKVLISLYAPFVIAILRDVKFLLLIPWKVLISFANIFLSILRLFYYGTDILFMWLLGRYNSKFKTMLQK